MKNTRQCNNGACAYTPAEVPKVFCPSCGAMWDTFKPPSKSRREPAMDKGKPKKRQATKKKGAKK